MADPTREALMRRRHEAFNAWMRADPPRDAETRNRNHALRLAFDAARHALDEYDKGHEKS